MLGHDKIYLTVAEAVDSCCPKLSNEVWNGEEESLMMKQKDKVLYVVQTVSDFAFDSSIYLFIYPECVT